MSTATLTPRHLRFLNLLTDVMSMASQEMAGIGNQLADATICRRGQLRLLAGFRFDRPMPSEPGRFPASSDKSKKCHCQVETRIFEDVPRNTRSIPSCQHHKADNRSYVCGGRLALQRAQHCHHPTPLRARHLSYHDLWPSLVDMYSTNDFFTRLSGISSILTAPLTSPPTETNKHE